MMCSSRAHTAIGERIALMTRNRGRARKRLCSLRIDWGREAKRRVPGSARAGSRLPPRLRYIQYSICMVIVDTPLLDVQVPDPFARENLPVPPINSTVPWRNRIVLSV